jgi:tetratricopeptide (TPR) repeat protein
MKKNKRKARNKHNRIVNRHQISGTIIDLYQGGQYAKAKKLIKKVLLKNEKDITALYYDALIEKDKGNFDIAEKKYNRLLTFDRTYIHAYFDLAGIAFDQGDFKTAKNVLKRL